MVKPDVSLCDAQHLDSDSTQWCTDSAWHWQHGPHVFTREHHQHHGTFSLRLLHSPQMSTFITNIVINFLNLKGTLSYLSTSLTADREATPSILLPLSQITILIVDSSQTAALAGTKLERRKWWEEGVPTVWAESWSFKTPNLNQLSTVYCLHRVVSSRRYTAATDAGEN